MKKAASSAPAHAGKKPMAVWMVEFSKKVVILCVVMHVVSFAYSAVVMWRFMDISTLPTIIAESSDVLRTCVFGYFVKAGLENWQKIKGTADNPAVQNVEGPKG